MPRGRESETRARKRVSNACRRCRKHKIKCSGNGPCQTCTQKRLRCEFEAEDRKVVISESVLNDLKARLKQLEEQQFTQPQQESLTESLLDVSGREPDDSGTITWVENNAVPMDVTSLPEVALVANETSETIHVEPIDPTFAFHGDGDSDRNDMSNLLVHERPDFILDNSGNLRFLGQTSTWSFTRQVLRLAQQSPDSHPSSTHSVHVEAEAYKLDLTGPVVTAADLVGLPSIDLAVYYVQAVKFRTHPLYHLFDESDFNLHLQRFYDHSKSYAQEHGMWFTHYLIIMAFGKAFVGQRSSSAAPTGSELFTRALRLLPDVNYLCRDRVRATEVFCCVALYFQSIDYRTAANISIGQAVRMAQSHGLHTDLQAGAIGLELATRAKRVWWTVYTLDRKLSCSMGLPDTLRDDDVTVPLPDAADQGLNAIGQSIHVKICQLLGKIINTVYSRNGELNKSFLTTAQTVLRGIATLATELERFSERTFGEISRFAANLNLAYHYCILLATRPFLFYILKARVDRSNSCCTSSLSSSAKGLLQVCIDSAMQIVAVASGLKDHDLLDTFLPFDLETVFSAAFVLVMAASLHPKLLPQKDWFNAVMMVFEHMSAKGYVLASLRKTEVVELSQMIHNFGYQSLDSADRAVGPLPGPPSAGVSMPDHTSLPSLGDPFFDEWIADDGLSGAQIMNLADAMQPEGLDEFVLQHFGSGNMP